MSDNKSAKNTPKPIFNNLFIFGGSDIERYIIKDGITSSTEAANNFHGSFSMLVPLIIPDILSGV